MKKDVLSYLFSFTTVIQKTVPDKTISIDIGDFTDVTKHSSAGFLIVPEDSGSLTVSAGDADHAVMYNLPRSAMGDKVHIQFKLLVACLVTVVILIFIDNLVCIDYQTLSYNGHLRFSVAREYVDGPENVMEDMGPVAHIWGNFHYQLFHYGEPNILGSVFTYDIPLHEV